PTPRSSSDRSRRSGRTESYARATAGLPHRLRRLALLLLLLARPDPGEVPEPLRAEPVGGGTRHTAGDGLDGGGGDDRGPVGLLRRRLGRLLLVEDPPDRVEHLLAHEPGDQSDDEAEGLVENLHAGGTSQAVDEMARRDWPDRRLTSAARTIIMASPV